MIGVCLALVTPVLLVLVRTSPLWTRAVGSQLEAAARAVLSIVRRVASQSDEILQELLLQAAADQDIRILMVGDIGTIRFDTDGAWTGERLPAPARRRILRGTPPLTACVEKLSFQAETGGVALALDVPTGLAVQGDGDRLSQAFTRLVESPVAHSVAAGKVSVVACPYARLGFVKVEVADTGDGIPSDQPPRFLERLYQDDRARWRNRGAGLGLAITKEIVEAHGGAICVEERRPTRQEVHYPATSPS